MPEAYDVVWCGSRTHPKGGQLLVETEAAYAARQRPYRTMRDLTLAEKQLVIAVARQVDPETASARFHVSPNTVQALLANGPGTRVSDTKWS